MKKIFVGMSGGVDSSVTAALLKKQGFDVTGVFMKNWTQDLPGFECPWREDLLDAKSVAAKLDIPIKIYDFQDEYKQHVVDYMVAEYKAGRTPNPDILCNQEVKFKLFIETALKDGADMIATGHYARTKDGQLLRAKDEHKDQTYFMYRVEKSALLKTILPLGEYEKSEVRKLAEKFELLVADKPDSQGLCFVGDISLKEFLSNFIQTTPGPIKSLKGELLGEHDGAEYYTIGQRQGLGVGGGTPYFVISKDMANNTVYVTDDPDDLFKDSTHFSIQDTHWIDGKPEPKKTYQVRIRHGGDLVDCTLLKTTDGYDVKVANELRAISPGQSAVVYDGEAVLGGGIIQNQVVRQ